MTPISLQSVGQLLGRTLIGLLFILAGIFHLRDQSFFYPGLVYVGGAPEATLPFGYLVEFAAALALIAGWRTRWAAWVLIFYTLVLSIVARALAGPDDSQLFAVLTHAARNAGVIGGLLYLAIFGGGPLGLDKDRERGA